MDKISGCGTPFLGGILGEREGSRGGGGGGGVRPRPSKLCFLAQFWGHIHLNQ